MPTRQVTIQGVMTWDEPPGIWGPTDPRPTPPIHIPGQPPGIWGGGNVPMPSPPIHLGPGGGVGGPPGIWGPTDPRPGWGLPGEQPGGGGGGSVLPPSVGTPIKGSISFVPGYGWVFVPEKADAKPDQPPPTVDNTLPPPQPKR